MVCLLVSSRKQKHLYWFI